MGTVWTNHSRRLGRRFAVTALFTAAALLAGTPSAVLASTTAGAVEHAATAASDTSVTCHSATHPKLAVRMAHGIAHALADRESVVGLAVRDSKTAVRCSYHDGWQFYSASVVKVTILAALLHKLMVKHRYLTSEQAYLAKLMIEYSNNDAASTLWRETGRWWLQRFLNLANMKHTVLGPGGYWGLTLITAHDELTQLRVLTTKNKILDKASRHYELNLMAHVVSYERWGVSAGAPTGVTVHIKNGWLPLALHAWHINSIGAFTSKGRVYYITVLTNDNPTMGYGVTTVQDAATVINHDLNPGTSATVSAVPQPVAVPGG